MVYKTPSYEEYSKASEFAKIRYKYGVYVQAIAVILLLFLLFYTITNIEEMKANPKEYAEKRLGVVCNYPIQFYESEIEINEIQLQIDNNYNFSQVEQGEISYIEEFDTYYTRDKNNKLIVTSGERGYNWLIEKYK